MIGRALITAALAAGSVFAAPVANAEVIDCQIQGILVIVALTGPVTVCSIDTNAPRSTDVDPSLQINPHLFGK